jgi:hypothetical protein
MVVIVPVGVYGDVFLIVFGQKVLKSIILLSTKNEVAAVFSSFLCHWCRFASG